MPGSAGRPECLGDIAHDAAETTTAFPLKIGGEAKEHDGTDPGSVAENDRVNARFRRDGCQYVDIGHPFFFQTTVAYASSTTNSALIATPGAGVSLYITDVMAAADTLASITFVENTAAPTNRILNMRIPANDTVFLSLRNPIKCTANVNFGVTTNVTNTSFLITGFIAP